MHISQNSESKTRRKKIDFGGKVEKLVTGDNRGKESNRCQARENVQLVPSAGKRATGVMRGKTCNQCQARENMQLVPNAGKRAAGVMRGKCEFSNPDCGTAHRTLNFLEHS